MGHSVNNINYRLGVSFFWRAKMVTPTCFFYYSLLFDNIGLRLFVNFMFFIKYKKILIKAGVLLSHLIQRFFVNKLEVRLFAFDSFFFNLKRQLFLLFFALFRINKKVAYRKRLRQLFMENNLQPYAFLFKFNVIQKKFISVVESSSSFVNIIDITGYMHTFFAFKNYIFLNKVSFLFENVQYLKLLTYYKKAYVAFVKKQVKFSVPSFAQRNLQYKVPKQFAQKVIRMASDFFSYGRSKKKFGRSAKFAVKPKVMSLPVDTDEIALSNKEVLVLVMKHARLAIDAGKTVDEALKSLIVPGVSAERYSVFTISNSKKKQLFWHFNGRRIARELEEEKTLSAAQVKQLRESRKIEEAKKLEESRKIEEAKKLKKFKIEQAKKKLKAYLLKNGKWLAWRKHVSFKGVIERLNRNYFRCCRFIILKYFQFFKEVTRISSLILSVIWRILFRAGTSFFFLQQQIYAAFLMRISGVSASKVKFKKKTLKVMQLNLALIYRLVVFNVKFLSFIFSKKITKDGKFLTYYIDNYRYFIVVYNYFFFFNFFLKKLVFFRRCNFFIIKNYFISVINSAIYNNKSIVYSKDLVFYNENKKLQENSRLDSYLRLVNTFVEDTEEKKSLFVDIRIKMKRKKANMFGMNSIFKDANNFFFFKYFNQIFIEKKLLLVRCLLAIFVLTVLYTFLFIEKNFYYIVSFYIYFFFVFIAVSNFKRVTTPSLVIRVALLFVPVLARSFFFKKVRISIVVLSSYLCMYFKKLNIVKNFFFYKKRSFYKFFLIKITFISLSFYLAYKVLSLIRVLESFLFVFSFKFITFYSFYWEFIYYLVHCSSDFYACSILFFYELYVQFLLNSFLNKMFMVDFFSEKSYKRFFFKKIKSFHFFKKKVLIPSKFTFFVKKYDAISKIWFDTLRFMLASYNLYKVRTGLSAMFKFVSVISVSLYDDFFFSKYFLVKDYSFIKKDFLFTGEIFKFSSVLLNIFFKFLGKKSIVKKNKLITKEFFSKNGIRISSYKLSLKKKLFRFYFKKQKVSLLLFTFQNFWKHQKLSRIKRAGHQIILPRSRRLSSMAVNVKDVDLLNLLLMDNQVRKSPLLDLSFYLVKVKKISFFNFFLKQFNLGSYYINYNMLLVWVRGYLGSGSLLQDMLNELLAYYVKNKVVSNVMENNWVVLFIFLLLFLGRFYIIKAFMSSTKVTLTYEDILEFQLFFFWSLLTVVYKEYCFNYWLRFVALVKKFVREKFIKLLEVKLTGLVNKKVEISFIDLKMSTVTPELLFYFYKKRLSKYYGFRSILKSVFFMLLELNLINGAYVSGFGRFTKKQRASSFKFFLGTLSKMDLSLVVNSFSSSLITKYGACGVHIYLCRKLKMTNVYKERSDYTIYHVNKTLYRNVSFS